MLKKQSLESILSSIDGVTGKEDRYLISNMVVITIWVQLGTGFRAVERIEEIQLHDQFVLLRTDSMSSYHPYECIGGLQAEDRLQPKGAGFVRNS